MTQILYKKNSKIPLTRKYTITDTNFTYKHLHRSFKIAHTQITHIEREHRDRTTKITIHTTKNKTHKAKISLKALGILLEQLHPDKYNQSTQQI